MVGAAIPYVAVAVAFAFAYANACGATTFPVGPITFGSDADYDNNFKESPGYSGIYSQLKRVP